MRWLSLSLVGVVLVATIGLSWLFDVFYQEYVGASDNVTEAAPQDEIQHAERLTQQLALTLSQFDDIDGFMSSWQNTDGYQLQTISLENLPLPSSLLKSMEQGQPLNLESNEDVTIHVVIPNSDEILQLTIPLPPMSENQFVDRFWITSLFYLILIAMFLLWARPLITRLIVLRSSARAFGTGDLSQRIKVGKTSYISDLEVEFNHMAQRIEDLVSDVKLLSSAVSHDLRTPLARIRMGLDTLSEEEDPKKRLKYEDRINDHIDDMVELIETLLSYARLDQAMLELEKLPVDMNALLQNLVTKKQLSGKTIHFDVGDSGKKYLVSGDATYLKMLCNNLVQNALQHCETQVHVSLKSHEGQLFIRVTDDGPGIPDELLLDVFKPFVRNRNSHHKGHGVGLAICKRVTDWHQGTLSVSRNEELGGADFVVCLPKG